MKCELCDKDAKVHLTEIIAGKKSEKHFCDSCVDREKSVSAEIPSFLAKAAVTYESSGGDMVMIARRVEGIKATDLGKLLTDAGIYCFVKYPELVVKIHPDTGNPLKVSVEEFEIHVPAKDADRAREMIRAAIEDVEPVEEPADLPPILNDEGGPVKVVAAAGFETVRQMYDGTLALAAEGIHYYSPKLARRGTKPVGQGKRFVIRVREEDLECAMACLADAEEDAEQDSDPRCPICKSRQIGPVSQFWLALRAFFDLGKWSAKISECVMCHHRAPPADFDG